MKMTILKIQKHQSKLADKGHFYYVFFKGEDGLSYKTCLYPKFHNFERWRQVVGLPIGSVIDVLVQKSNLINADMFPVIISKGVADETRA
jgi:hypothetical protein